MATSTERINQLMKEKRLRQIDVLNLAKPLQEKYNIKSRQRKNLLIIKSIWSYRSVVIRLQCA